MYQEEFIPSLQLPRPKIQNAGGTLFSRGKIYSIPICCYFSSNKSTCFSNVFASSLDAVDNVLEDDLLDSDYSSSLVTVKSLTVNEFDSCKSKVCSVRGKLARCYQE